MESISGSVLNDKKTILKDMAFDPELTPGARNAVNVCLRIQPEEKVTVITDEFSKEIAASLVHELERIGCPYNTFVMEELAPRPLCRLPCGNCERHGDQPGQHFCSAGANETNCNPACK